MKIQWLGRTVILLVAVLISTWVSQYFEGFGVKVLLGFVVGSMLVAGFSFNFGALTDEYIDDGLGFVGFLLTVVAGATAGLIIGVLGVATHIAITLEDTPAFFWSVWWKTPLAGLVAAGCGYILSYPAHVITFEFRKLLGKRQAQT